MYTTSTYYTSTRYSSNGPTLTHPLSYSLTKPPFLSPFQHLFKNPDPASPPPPSPPSPLHSPEEWGKTRPDGLKARFINSGKLAFGQVPVLSVDDSLHIVQYVTAS